MVFLLKIRFNRKVIHMNVSDLIEAALTDASDLDGDYLRDGTGNIVPAVNWSGSVEIYDVRVKATRNGHPRIMIMFRDPDVGHMLFENISFSGNPVADRISIETLINFGVPLELIQTGNLESWATKIKTIKSSDVRCIAHEHGDDGRLFPEYVWDTSSFIFGSADVVDDVSDDTEVDTDDILEEF